MAKKKVKKVIGQARTLFGDQLWGMNTDSLSGAKRRLIRFIKLVRITFSQFVENRMMIQCVGLSYFVALSIIPFCAFVFVVTDGLGLSYKLMEFMYVYIPADEAFLSSMVEKAVEMLEVAKSGGVGIVGAFALLWTIFRLMFQVEIVFNNVWGIKRIPRKLFKRIGFYVGVTILSPFVLAVFSAGIAIYSNFTSLMNLDIPLDEFSTLKTLAGWAIFTMVATFTFSAMFKFIPAGKIKYRNAFWSALATAVVFSIFQYLYLETQVFVSKANAVYGVIAAIPLFMMWLNYSWQIILYGAHLCYGMENINTYHIPEGPLRDFTPNRDRVRKEMEMEKIELEQA